MFRLLRFLRIAARGNFLLIYGKAGNAVLKSDGVIADSIEHGVICKICGDRRHLVQVDYVSNAAFGVVRPACKCIHYVALIRPFGLVFGHGQLFAMLYICSEKHFIAVHVDDLISFGFDGIVGSARRNYRRHTQRGGNGQEPEFLHNDLLKPCRGASARRHGHGGQNNSLTLRRRKIQFLLMRVYSSILFKKIQGQGRRFCKWQYYVIL